MSKLAKHLTSILFFAFWAVLIACGGSGGSGGSNTSYITYSTTNQLVYPALNGNYTFSDGTGQWLDLSTGQEYTLEFNIDGAGDARVVLYFQTAPGINLAAGQTFTWANTGAGWNFGTAQSLTAPFGSGTILLYSNTGTLNITSVTTNTDGSKRIQFNFTYGTTGSINGSGSGECTVTKITAA